MIVQIRVQEETNGRGVFKAVYSDLENVDEAGDDLDSKDKVQIRIDVVYAQTTWEREPTQEPTGESKVNETQEL